MAIAIRGSTPLVVATTGNPISGTLTGTQQPQAGDLLVIVHGNDYYDLSNMPTPTVGGSTSGVDAVTNGVADAGNPNAHVKAYTYAVGSTGDLTVAVTETGSGDEDKFLALYVLSGADIATPIDGGSSGAAGSFSAASQSTLVMTGVTPTGTDAYLIAHLNSGGGSSAGTPYTTPGGMTELYDAATGGISYVGAVEQLATSGATGTRTFTGSGSTPWAGVLVAVKTGSASAVAAVGTTAGVAVVKALASHRTASTATAAATAVARSTVTKRTPATATATAAAVARAATVRRTAVATATAVAATVRAVAGKRSPAVGRAVAVATALGAGSQAGPIRAATARCAAVATCRGRGRQRTVRPFTGNTSRPVGTPERTTRPYDGVVLRP